MVDPSNSRTKRRLPFHVVTGFLGSGKTALLRALLDHTEEKIAVLVNEVGELGLDHHLLERIDEDVLMLPGGCLCCEIRGELNAAIDRVVSLAPARIVLETTGLADPAPLLHTIATDPRLSAAVRLGGVIAVVDCLRAEELLAAHPEVRRQLDFADRVVLTKADLAPQRVEQVRDWLEREVPGRQVRIATSGHVDHDWLLLAAGFGRDDHGADVTLWLHHPVPGIESAAETWTTSSVRCDRPVEIAALQLWLRLVTQLDGPRLLRIKGIARCAETGACYALQSAGHAVSPPQRLGIAPASVTGAEFVLIERGMPPAAMSQLVASLRSAFAGDRRPLRSSTP